MDYSCAKVTLIALDCVHPCAYLWVGQSKHMADEQAFLNPKPLTLKP